MFSLLNFQDHPTNRNKEVFFYRNEEHANFFENLLIENKIEYEKQIDKEGDQRIYYGVKKTDFKLVKELNFITIGKFRKPFIPDLFFRYFLIFISILVVSLAIIGALYSK